MSSDKPPRSKREPAVTANLRKSWLTDPRFLRLSDDAKLLYLSGLMWCIDHTNGLLPDYALPLLWPADEQRRAEAATELGKDMWRRYERDGGGWRYPDWEVHQSTVEQIAYQRRRKRDDQRRHRAGESVTGDVTGDKTGEYLTSPHLKDKDAPTEETTDEDADEFNTQALTEYQDLRPWEQTDDDPPW